MMDLIDRNELEPDTEWSDYYDGFTSYSQSQINGAVEVQAIPIPDNATNGEALCMLFPNMHYTLSDKSPRVVTTIGVASSFDMDWWNAPYKKGESE